MATKIQVMDGQKVIGSMTIFDLEPSHEVLAAVFPDAVVIGKDRVSGQWWIDLGLAPAPALAD